mmetsp:Transcript_9463/g.22316  ORF Transcript_9463/g.22316 Transcript_9463/m.22316 type:complete len:92 (+) Transcript_9463:51-326(+)|eukprot:CAMPEP_0113628030 /NCGR_PEP_ID=MMETSP0017_2-20120614/14522_1 /TAXON_ID=2856 /ORGANISM="Cylindrotheca closterium" /LENGTH=91 /DNA_ID=CAMNT_0000538317 /DNA_START=41 /DNA_END=316 /DNA_ORIENTATION=+ /assembly_acc=CAM_ASM_000147
MASQNDNQISRVGPMEEGVMLVSSAINDVVYGHCGPVCFMGDCDKQLKFELAQETVAEYSVINVFNGMKANGIPSNGTLLDEDSVASGASR